MFCVCVLCVCVRVCVHVQVRVHGEGGQAVTDGGQSSEVGAQSPVAQYGGLRGEGVGEGRG